MPAFLSNARAARFKNNSIIQTNGPPPTLLPLLPAAQSHPPELGRKRSNSLRSKTKDGRNEVVEFSNFMTKSSAPRKVCLVSGMPWFTYIRFVPFHYGAFGKYLTSAGHKLSRNLSHFFLPAAALPKVVSPLSSFVHHPGLNCNLIIGSPLDFCLSLESLKNDFQEVKKADPITPLAVLTHIL